MRLIRFYKKKPVDMAQMRALQDVLAKAFQWQLTYSDYYLVYESEAYSTQHLDEADAIVRRKGQPIDLRAAYSASGSRMLTLETRTKPGISIDLDVKESDPEPVLERIQSLLSFELIGEVPTGRAIKSAFVAHGFHPEAEAYASEVARFLGLLGIKCFSGRAFAPTGVSEKVVKRLMQHDIFIAVLTPQEDATWITQEMATAAAFKKDIFILKEADVDVKTGILGDLEYISFPKNQISKTFIPILEGLNALQGLEISMAPYIKATTTRGDSGFEG